MRVSIGLPFLNCEKTLADAIRSVFAQSFEDWELILIDDGSSDRSSEIAYSIKDSRVRVYRDGENKGLANRLNQITNLAKGEYIARMDADDLMHPDRLKRQVKYLDEHPNVDLVATGTYSIDYENNILGLKSMAPISMAPDVVLLNKGLIVHPTVTGRAEWFRSNPYDDSLRFTEDRELWCRTCKYSLFTKIEDALFFYRETFKKESFLRKHLLSFKINRQLLKKYGFSYLGEKQTNLLILNTYLKVPVCYIVTLLGLHKLMIQKNIISIKEKEKNKGEKIMNYILKTPVPGLIYNN